MINNIITNFNFFDELKFELSLKKIKKEFSVLFNELSTQGSSFEKEDEIAHLLIQGKNLAHTLVNNKESPSSFSKERALALTWFIMACAFQESCSTFVRGTVRLLMDEETSKKFKHFLRDCEGAHSRPASHFNDMKIGSHKGIDFEKGTLPLDEELSTVLFNRLKDGSFYIKLEREALSITKPIQSIRHILHWINHNSTHGGLKEVKGKATRRETDGQDELKEAFSYVINEWHKIEIDLDVKQELKTHNRIFKMVAKVNQLKDEISKKGYSFLHDRLKKAIDHFKEIADKIPQAEIISGNEVLLSLDKYIYSRISTK